MLRITVPVDGGNKAIQDGTLQKIVSDAIERLKPESAYFFADRGVRTAMMIIDLNDTSDIPSITEPFFTGLSAAVELIPVMNAEELKKGLAKAMQNR
jgi:hypothetical protein